MEELEELDELLPVELLELLLLLADRLLLDCELELLLTEMLDEVFVTELRELSDWLLGELDDRLDSLWLDALALD